MARTTGARRRRLPFRIPIFRVFYSLTYTTLYLLTLVFLAISPVTMIYSSLTQNAFQYTFMIGSVIILTAIIAVCLYSSRLYTNKRVLSDVGKSYVPIEEGEVGKAVRKMIVKQLDRSAIVAWESRPRDLYGEILLARQEGILPMETESFDVNDCMVGSEIQIDPAHPPWGDIQHPGWSSPSHRNDNRNPDVQFADVIAELPNLIEARAVSLAPPDPTMTPVQGAPRAADPAVVGLLTRPPNMALRDYLTQLGYLGLVQPPSLGQNFVSQYEKARFGFLPVSVDGFDKLMTTFAQLLAGMTTLNPDIVHEIRAQTNDDAAVLDVPVLSLTEQERDDSAAVSSARTWSPQSSLRGSVTAREDITPAFASPYLMESAPSQESFGSVLWRSPDSRENPSPHGGTQESIYTMQTPSATSFPSETGSVLIHDREDTG